jgi:peptidoglycan/xylan/chitin deacetylase (PgdA/CDA1 family)
VTMAGNPADLLTNDGTLVIYLFHGVVEASDYEVRNYTRKHLPATEFSGIVESLARSGEPLSMDRVTSIALSGQPFPRGAFAVTFDDGFENNLTVARPVLEAFRIPATVYATSRFVDENGMSWIDRIELALEHASRGELRLPWADASILFDGRQSKISLLDEIRLNVKSDRRLDGDHLASDIFGQLGQDDVRSSDDPLDRKLTWQQLREWVAPGYGVGGHTHTHAILSFLSPEKLAWELDTSLGLLRERGGITTPHYSYPEGLAHCYSPEVIAALKRRSIVCCPTAIDGINPPAIDPFHLRRVMVS